MDIEKLIERLKNAGGMEAYFNDRYNGLYHQAADTITQLRAELEQVKAERDAAVDCCSGYCASCLFVKDCAKHDMNDAAPTRWYYGDCEDWEWRGWKEG